MKIDEYARLPAEQRRRQILKSARDVFTHLGSDNARTLDVAQAAGINEALIYKHFSSKQELYDAAVLDPLREFIAHLGAYAEQVLAAADESGPTRSSAKCTGNSHSPCEK